MIETTVLDYLSGELAEPCYMEVPSNPPETFVVIEKTGSSRTDHVNTATLAIQSYAGSLEQAAELNDRVKTAMDNITTLADIGGVKLNSDYNFTNTQTKKYRYQAVYVLTYI